MRPGDMLYEGKAKQLFLTEDSAVLRVKYKDSATAFNNQKRATLEGKGEMNNRISTFFFELLNKKGIANHFIKAISPLEQLVKRVEIIPIEVVVRNIAAGTMAKRLGIAEGTKLKHTIVEFYYKDDALGDPLITEEHISVLELATPEQVAQLREQALRVNEVLSAFLLELNIILVDFKLEFGVDGDGNVLLADEISPDTCRFWEKETGERLDKDRFRRDMGQVVEAYHEIWNRLGGK
ncbi:phosphoribosylaminoimidazolesuccinocarboxamide synthase [Laceyella sacchari]|uniref:Phosphoribosylaminoimidazole-succinocarboxamide synthase n=1 Tax=Laceyella sacchari TaxID=37482 RepID=A0ABY5U5V7_LACSH|nr:phosphoribosylaminoimidazolesuccinocarboxamide synthase [Laceyella sacchari]UWE03960.1 phosphoribosylaminoimidazolesuccinocarboxamide synthase [Laceyella sacchari]